MIHRRDFLRLASIGAAALAIPAWMVKAQDREADTVILNGIPFFSQWHSSAPAYGDCGEACWRMLLMWRALALGLEPERVYSVTDISNLWGKQYDAESFMLEHHEPHIYDLGFDGTYTEHASADWYREQIAAGCPCVALVTYGGFTPENRADTYVEGHYVLVVGFNPNGFYIHDPLWLYEADGAYRFISNSEWTAASTGYAITVTGFRN